MRDEFAAPSVTALRRRMAIGTVLGLGGVAAAVAGAEASNAGAAAGLTGLGLVAICAAPR